MKIFRNHLVGIIQSWVSTGTSLILDGLLVRVSGECPTAISIVRTPSSTSVTSSQTTSSSSPRFPSTSSIVLLPSTTRNYKVSRQNWCLSWRMASSRKNCEREYLMMCLKPSIPDQELHRYIPTSSDAVPLVVRFSSGCVPLGCFGSTISCLLSKYRWEVVRGEDGAPKCLAHNIASLHDPQLLVDVLLVDFTQVHVTCDLGIHQLPPNTCSLVLTNVFGAIEKVFEIMRLGGDKMGITPAVLCPCTKVEEKHMRRDSKYFLRCSRSTSIPDEKQMLWMGNITANTKLTLPQLVRLKIPEKIGGHYREFGTLLLDDDTGDLVDIAEKSCHYQSEEIVTRILCKWLTQSTYPSDLG